MPTSLPLSDEEILARIRAELGFELPAECLPGVRANLAVLADHLRTLEGAGE